LPGCGSKILKFDPIVLILWIPISCGRADTDRSSQVTAIALVVPVKIEGNFLSVTKIHSLYTFDSLELYRVISCANCIHAQHQPKINILRRVNIVYVYYILLKSPSRVICHDWEFKIPVLKFSSNIEAFLTEKTPDAFSPILKVLASNNPTRTIRIRSSIYISFCIIPAFIGVLSFKMENCLQKIKNRKIYLSPSFMSIGFTFNVIKEQYVVYSGVIHYISCGCAVINGYTACLIMRNPDLEGSDCDIT